MLCISYVDTLYETKTVSTTQGTFTFYELYQMGDELSKSLNPLKELKRKTEISEAELSRIFKKRLSLDEIAAIMLNQPQTTTVWARCKPVRKLTLRQVSSGECYNALFTILERMKINLPKP